MKRGDRVIFKAPTAFGSYHRWEGLTGVVVDQDEEMGKSPLRYVVYWSNGKKNTEWEMYLQKIDGENAT